MLLILHPFVLLAYVVAGVMLSLVLVIMITAMLFWIQYQLKTIPVVDENELLMDPADVADLVKRHQAMVRRNPVFDESDTRLPISEYSLV